MGPIYQWCAALGEWRSPKRSSRALWTDIGSFSEPEGKHSVARRRKIIVNAPDPNANLPEQWLLENFEPKAQAAR
jgi:hypothetical protein